jgi:short-subunit dehydrogenase
MNHRTAFVTGASSGIGRVLAARLAREGVEVALAARREGALHELAREITERRGRARVYPLDVTDVEATTLTLKRADAEMGGIDLVVANAGINRHRWSGGLTYAECADIIAVNVQGAVATLTALLPAMVERRRGHLVGVSSLAQYRGMPWRATYSASKAFLSHFLEGLRADLGETGVAVSDIRLGFVRTAMTAASALPQPFLTGVDQAVDVMVAAIEARAPIVAFPWQLATIARAGTLLPPRFYDRAVRRMGRQRLAGE